MTSSGRRVVLGAALATLLASPGQTYGFALFVDPVLEGLALERTQLSTLYMVITLLSAWAAPWMGRCLDRWGLERSTRWAGLGMVLGLVLLSWSPWVLVLFLGMFLARTLGQSGVQLLVTRAIAIRFQSDRGRRTGQFLALSALGIAAWPLGVERLLRVLSWRESWGLLAVLTLLAWWVLTRAWAGLEPSGQDPAHAQVGAPGGASLTVQEAMRTPAWWCLCLGPSLSAGVITALGFHHVQLFSSSGLDIQAAASNLSLQFLSTAACGFLVGPRLDAERLQRYLALSFAFLGGALLLLPKLGTGQMSLLYALCIGCCAGTGRAVGGVAWPRWFGLRHLGGVQGMAWRFFVVSSALGPVLLSMGLEHTGSYTEPMLYLVPLPWGMAIWAWWLQPPGSPSS